MVVRGLSHKGLSRQGKPHLQRHAVLRADEWGREWGEFCAAAGVQSAGEAVEDEAGEEHEARM